MDYAAMIRLARNCGFPDEFIGGKDVGSLIIHQQDPAAASRRGQSGRMGRR